MQSRIGDNVLARLVSERIVRPANVTNLVNKDTEGFLETAMQSASALLKISGHTK